MADQRYPAQVFWSEEDEGFIAIAPDLPGCSAFGESQAEAIAELEAAIDGWTAAAIAAGNPVPAPSNLADQSYSGKVALRMPRNLHRDLVNAARNQGTSLNQYIVYLLSKNAQADVIVGPYLPPRQITPLTVQRVTAVCMHGQPIQAFGEIYSVDQGQLRLTTFTSSHGRELVNA